MPEQIAPPELPFVDLEREPFRKPDQQLDPSYAGELVRRTFDEYSRHRQQYAEPRWRKHNQLYFGWVKKRTWPGTNKPRAAVPVQIVLDHLEAAYPEAAAALFSQEPFWFEAISESGSSPKDAEAARARLSFILEQQGDVDGRTGVAELKRALRSQMHWGIGYVEVQYDPIQRRPFLEWLDPRDVYVSPNTGNWVDQTPAWIKRRFMSVQELEDLRDQPNMNIPPPAVLNHLAKNKNAEQIDTDKRDLGLGTTFSTGDSLFEEINPSQQDIEVWVYQSKSRIIWVLGRKWIAYSQPNPWGFLTLCAAPFLQVLGEHYGQALADLLENEQKLIQALTNAYLDEISLNLEPPRNALPQALSHPSQLYFRPGAIFKSSTPDKDLMPQFTQGATRDAFVAIDMAERRANKRTGISELAQSGLPTPSNANRTATGIATQLQAATRRLFTPIDNFETYLLIPALRKLHKMVQLIETNLEGLQGQGENGESVQVSGQQAGRPVRFKLLAASKMVARDRLAGVVPLVLQYVFNPQLIGEARKVGKVPNFEEIDRLVQESVGTRHRYELFRDLTPQERQAAQQPDPQVQQQAQAKQQDAATRLQIMRAKLQGEREKMQAKGGENAEKMALELLKVLIPLLQGNDKGENNDTGGTD